MSENNLNPVEGKLLLRFNEGTCRVCGGKGWHTAGGNDPAACGACSAGEAFASADSIRTAAKRAVDELRRQASAWLTVAPILEAHVYEPREDGYVWNAYTRWNRGSQALAVASCLRAALAADRERPLRLDPRSSGEPEPGEGE